ncbi:MAG: S49 family peptidase [Patescibacteria group bacterium]
MDFIRNHKGMFYVLIGAAGFVALNIAGNFIYDGLMVKSGALGSEDGAYLESDEKADCNALGINLHGSLYTYLPLQGEGGFTEDTDVVSSEDILYYLDEANRDENIKAIIVEVDSLGGWPVAGEEVANALKNSPKPTVAFIRQAGTSAAYWAASGAERVFASKNSDVGSIGVTQSYLDNVIKNQKEGLGFVELAAGKYKDTGNPDKTLTAEEKALLIRDLNITHENFISAVAENRGLSIEAVRKIADGSSVLGEKAKTLGLIDEIGGLVEVEEYLSEKIGEQTEICWN